MGNQPNNIAKDEDVSHKRITFEYIAPIRYETEALDLDDEDWNQNGKDPVKIDSKKGLKSFTAMDLNKSKSLKSLKALKTEKSESNLKITVAQHEVTYFFYQGL